MDREIELEHLRQAEAGIAKGRERIKGQEAVVAKLSQGGHDVGTAISVLQTMQQALTAMEQHRRTIL